MSRIDEVYAYHASTDASMWRLIRLFRLADRVPEHEVGFEVQSPTGNGCTVTFGQIRFERRRLTDMRDGS